MTTPRIEENEKNKPPRHITLGGETYIYLSDHKEALTQAHQAGIDEVVEKIEKISKSGITKGRDWMFKKEAVKAIKALQDNK